MDRWVQELAGIFVKMVFGRHAHSDCGRIRLRLDFWLPDNSNSDSATPSQPPLHFGCYSWGKRDWRKLLWFNWYGVGSRWFWKQSTGIEDGRTRAGGGFVDRLGVKVCYINLSFETPAYSSISSCRDIRKWNYNIKCESLKNYSVFQHLSRR